MTLFQNGINKRNVEDFRAMSVHLWLVSIACIIIPFLIDFILRSDTPLVVYLLFLIPIIVFAIYFSIRKMLLSISIFSLFHSLMGVVYEVQHGGGINDIDIRLYNHIGFTVVSFAIALLVGGLLKEMKESELRYRSVVENAPQLIVIHQYQKIVYANPTSLELFGINKVSDIIGKSITEFIDPSNREKLVQRIREVSEDHRGNEFIEYKVSRPDGKQLYLEMLGKIINFKGQPAILVVGKDVTSKKEYQEKIEHLAYHDHLTGLPNRFLLNRQLEETLANYKGTNNKLSLLFIDLDRFKFINDTMGHKLGDNLLIQVSERLVKNVRDGDVVARQGGDEFLVLLKNGDSSHAQEVAERILKCFTIPFIIDGEEFYSSPSIGISTYPNDGEDADTLIKNADKAMYLAKKRGRNNFEFYLKEDESILERKLLLERELKKAIYKKQLILHYQPKVEMVTGKIYGVEALLRWQHPELGLISPAEMIPIAEESGMIIPIGEWVLRESCKQIKAWEEAGFFIKIAVNVSSLQFGESRFVETVKAVLSESQLSPERLCLEITESIMQDIKQSSVIILELKELGVEIAVDDFGTGYSSLSVLNSLSIDTVKIDKSFVKDISSNSNTASLVKTIIEMGENLKFGLVAEGIEDKRQAEFLIQHGCIFGQGFFFSPPLPVAEIENLLIEQNLS
ncbi:putative bifunctional diguanylate cyclase/phosphodiesterase [Bacillus sp. Marseille-P3661]|uniref:putative bifunctional diguanylate cyclase/phosphodiesterase n=1 Tax=Bacillus sp. Marseille-P3661 TaxID=1936234 RepID=UPI0015E1B893|nr:bifunctional diguanylate cyclase/phosphodiesterase [Bacillus sp. Marseille-P3661]